MGGADEELLSLSDCTVGIPQGSSSRVSGLLTFTAFSNAPYSHDLNCKGKFSEVGRAARGDRHGVGCIGAPGDGCPPQHIMLKSFPT